MINSRLRGVTVPMIGIGMRMKFGSHTTQDHRRQQQQARQLPDRALDPEVHRALEDSTRHGGIMTDKRAPLNSPGCWSHSLAFG